MPSRVRGVLGALLGAFVRLWVLTLRVTVEWRVENHRAAPGRVLAFFHGHQMALLGAEKRRGTAVLVSRSADGDVQAGVMRAFGFFVVRGSSSRGGTRGLRAVVRQLVADRDAAFAVDGPRGPFGVAKAGAVLAARATGAPLLPVASAARSAWVLERAWDRFEIPLPFSRVAIVVGEALAAADATTGALSAAIASARLRAEGLVSSDR